MSLSKLSFWSCCCAGDLAEAAASEIAAFAVESASAAIVTVSAFYSVGPPAGEMEDR